MTHRFVTVNNLSALASQQEKTSLPGYVQQNSVLNIQRTHVPDVFDYDYDQNVLKNT